MYIIWLHRFLFFTCKTQTASLPLVTRYKNCSVLGTYILGCICKNENKAIFGFASRWKYVWQFQNQNIFSVTAENNFFINVDSVNSLIFTCLSFIRASISNKIACAPSKDSDLHASPCSLIRVFAVSLKMFGIIGYTQRAILRPW